VEQVFQAASNEAIHQICFWPANGAADLERERVVTRLARRREIVTDHFEKLAMDLVINRELRIEIDLAIKRDRAFGRKPNVRRTQNQLVDCGQSWRNMVFRFGLLQLKLC